MNTTDFLDIGNAICPNRDLIVFEGKRWSYAQIYERVNRLAKGLKDLGVQKGDRIGMLQVNCNQYMEAYFASAKVGAIFVPLNFRAKAEELSYVINNASAKVLFVGQRYLEMIHEIVSQSTTVKHVICLEGIDERGISYEDLMNSSHPEDISA